jgi:hypothetical protein
MKLMGHRSITVSQKYVDPPESVELAFERLQNLNNKAQKSETHIRKKRGAARVK